MDNTIAHPMAEAKVQIHTHGEGWRDSLDFDPVMIPVEDVHLTDAFNSTVIGLVEAITSVDSARNTKGMPDIEYNLVWSATGNTVKANCPVCDDVFPVAEGEPGDEFNEGYDAVWCGGCEPVDED